MDRDIELDVHASSCTVATVGRGGVLGPGKSDLALSGCAPGGLL